MSILNLVHCEFRFALCRHAQAIRFRISGSAQECEVAPI